MKTDLFPHFSNYNSPNFPKITKPKIIGYFTLNKNREYLSDYSGLKYLVTPENPTNLNFDLNIGYEISKPKPNKDEKIDQLLNFILQQFKTNFQALNYDFICFRGLLRLIMCTPYENRESWTIIATKWKNSIYLCGIDTEEKKLREKTETIQSKIMCFYGFKFEQYFLSSEPNKIPETHEPINLSEEFCGMFETQIENKKILYGAEMDGILSDKLITPETNFNELNFIELKVKRNETNFRQKINFFKFKAIKWWCQSFLVGIQTIIVGNRNDNGILKSYEKMDVKNLAKESNDYWSAAVCMRFLVEFLKQIEGDMSDIDSPHTVFKYDYDPKIHSVIERTVFEGVNDLSFLPEWYCKNFKST